MYLDGEVRRNMEMTLLVIIILLLGYAIATIGDSKEIIISMKYHTKKMMDICDSMIKKIKDKGGK